MSLHPEPSVAQEPPSSLTQRGELGSPKSEVFLAEGLLDILPEKNASRSDVSPKKFAENCCLTLNPECGVFNRSKKPTASLNTAEIANRGLCASVRRVCDKKVVPERLGTRFIAEGEQDAGAQIALDGLCGREQWPENCRSLFKLLLRCKRVGREEFCLGVHQSVIPEQ
jgi:hypothetical protein